MAELPPAVNAKTLFWELPEVGRVCCYHQPGHGRPLLLLHSINAAPSAFEVSPLFDAAPLGRPLYAPDLPGFGRSARPDTDYSPELYARAIVAMAEELGGDVVDVLALSTTSEFAARAIQMSPDRFGSLTLISPTGFTRRRAQPSGVGKRVLRFFQLPGVGSSLYRLLRTRPSVRYFLDQAFRASAPSEMVDYACATAAQPGARHAPFHFLTGRFFSHDAIGCLYEHLQLPVLVLYDQDPNISFRFLHEFAGARENWRLQRIPETFGLPHFDDPGLTNEALEAFLSANDAGAAT